MDDDLVVVVRVVTIVVNAAVDTLFQVVRDVVRSNIDVYDTPCVKIVDSFQVVHVCLAGGQ